MKIKNHDDADEIKKQIHNYHVSYIRSKIKKFGSQTEVVRLINLNRPVDNQLTWDTFYRILKRNSFSAIVRLSNEIKQIEKYIN